MQFKTIPASNTCDVMERNAAMNPRIRLMSSPKDQMMVGPALTVKGRAGDNLALHAALNIAQEGDVLVVSNEGDNTRALIGEVMMAYLRYTKKVAGIIIDGPIRDIDEIGNWDFPVYATGTTPGGPYKEGPGEINVPISCGEISVNPRGYHPCGSGWNYRNSQKGRSADLGSGEEVPGGGREQAGGIQERHGKPRLGGEVSGG